MTTSNRQNIEKLLFLAAILLALALRLVRLSALPLSDFEANFALQALNGQASTAAQPAYTLPTGLLFFLFGASELWARLLPALTGTALVFVPWLFRDRLPGRAAVIMAFFLAVDPGLVGMSRTAGSPILSIAFALFALGMWRNRQYRWAGIFGALLLLSGAALWPGLLALVVAYLGTGGAGWMKIKPVETESGDGEAESAREKWRAALISGGALLLGAGTLFFLSSGALSIVFGAPVDYLRGWLTPNDVPAVRVLGVLLVHELFALIFAVAAVVRGALERDRNIIFLGVWALAALGLALVYPARQVADLAWMLVPLMALAALELDRLLDWEPTAVWETLGTFTLTVAVLVFAYMDFQSLAINTFDQQETTMRWLLFGGAFLLLVISITLVGLGWSVDVARRGLIWGVAITLCLYTLSAASGAAGMRTVPSQSPWRVDPQTFGAAIVQATIDQLNATNVSEKDRLDIVVYNLQSPALQWLLRNENVQFTAGIAGGDAPSIIIGPVDPNPAFSSAYRGQDFVWRHFPGWNTNTPADWLRWIATQNAPVGEDYIILWARNDLFLDSQNTTQNSNPYRP